MVKLVMCCLDLILSIERDQFHQIKWIIKNIKVLKKKYE